MSAAPLVLQAQGSPEPVADPERGRALDDMLDRPDETLGALVVSALSWDPPAEAFAALGRLVRAGARADQEALVLRRRGRR